MAGKVIDFRRKTGCFNTFITLTFSRFFRRYNIIRICFMYLFSQWQYYGNAHSPLPWRAAVLAAMSTKTISGDSRETIPQRVLARKVSWVGGGEGIETISRSSRLPPTRFRTAILIHDKILSLLPRSIKRSHPLPPEVFVHFLHPQKSLFPSHYFTFVHHRRSFHCRVASSRLEFMTVPHPSDRENKEKRK